MAKIKIGQIGVGHAHASGKMRVYRASKEFEIVGVVECRAQHAERGVVTPCADGHDHDGAGHGVVAAERLSQPGVVVRTGDRDQRARREEVQSILGAERDRIEDRGPLPDRGPVELDPTIALRELLQTYT